MNPNDLDGSREVVAKLVRDDVRLSVLPRHFGSRLLVAENLVFDFARELVPSYAAGYWNFYELSNRGFYMAPEMEKARLFVRGNGFDAELSADAIGIVVCPFAFSHGSFKFANDPQETFAEHYHRLWAFASGHAENNLILAAID